MITPKRLNVSVQVQTINTPVNLGAQIDKGRRRRRRESTQRLKYLPSHCETFIQTIFTRGFACRLYFWNAKTIRLNLVKFF